MTDAGAVPAGAASPTEPRVEFRQVQSLVRWNRIFCVAALVPLVPTVVLMVVGGWWFVAPIGIAMYALIVAGARRTERLAILSEGDELVVTNYSRTHRLRRDEIASVRVDRTLGRRWMRFEIRRKDGTGVFCDVMTGGPAMFRQSDVSIAMCRQAIEAWLHADAS